GGKYRRDTDVLWVAAGAPSASEVDEHAGANQSRVEASDSGGADLSQRSELLAADLSAGGGDPRGLGGGDTLSEHGGAPRATQRATARNGAGRLRDARKQALRQLVGHGIVFSPGLHFALAAPQKPRRRAVFRPGLKTMKKCVSAVERRSQRHTQR